MNDRGTGAAEPVSALVCVGLALYLGARYSGFLTLYYLFVTLLSVTSIGIAGVGQMMLLISGN